MQHWESRLRIFTGEKLLPGLKTICIGMQLPNSHPSILLQRLNFSQEGVQKDKIWHSNRAHDMLLFSLTRNDWQLNHR